MLAVADAGAADKVSPDIERQLQNVKVEHITDRTQIAMACDSRTCAPQSESGRRAKAQGMSCSNKVKRLSQTPGGQH
jgi:hypothetical protein